MSESPTVDPALQVYYVVTGNLLTDAANKDPDVSLFTQQFITQKMALTDTAYGKAMYGQLSNYILWLQDQIASGGEEEKQLLQPELDNTIAFRDGMDITIDNVNADMDVEQLSITSKRAQLPPEEQWKKTPSALKWASHPYVPLPGGYKLPLPMGPPGMSRTVDGDAPCIIM